MTLDELKARLREDAALARNTFDFSPVHDMNSVLENRLLRFERSLKEALGRIEELERERDEARAECEQLREVLEDYLPNIENELQHWRMGSPHNMDFVEEGVVGIRAALTSDQPNPVAQARREAFEEAARECERIAWGHPNANTMGPEQNAMRCAEALRTKAKEQSDG